MEERYEWGYNGKVLKHYILDTETNDELGYEEIFDLLNQQDKEIKMLKEKYEDRKKFCINQVSCQQKLIDKLLKENQQLQAENGYIIFADGYDKNGNEIHRQEFVKYKDKFKELVEENKQLKQLQKQLAISELKKLKANLINKVSPNQRTKGRNR